MICPQGSTSGFLPILRERLNRDFFQTPLESEVVAICCEVLSTTLGQSPQKNLFHSKEDFEEAMASFVGQLEEFLGKDKVFWAKITEERFPEKSWIKTHQSENSQIDLEGRYPLRPTRIFRTPFPVTVLQDRVVWKGRSFKFKHWSRVERLSPDWLDDVPARNYYRVDLEGGRAIWVFSDPGHDFFVQGYFE